MVRTTPSRLFRVGVRRKTSSVRPATKPSTTPSPTSRPTKLTRRKFLPQITKALESQETTTIIPRTENRFRFISRKPVHRTTTPKKKFENPDQTIESSNQQSLEEDFDGGDTTELGDTAIALHSIQQAPIPTKSTLKSTVIYPSTTTTQRAIFSRNPSRTKFRYSTTTSPLSLTTTRTVVQRRKRPQVFEKIKPSTTYTFQPIGDYDDYYDDAASVLGQIPEHSKVLLHSNGVIECLDQGNFPHPISCKKFISCAKMENGNVLGWEYTCPKNLSFDPIGGICNWSAGLGCNEK